MNIVLSAAAANPVRTRSAAPYLLLDTDFTIRGVNDSYFDATEQAHVATILHHVQDVTPAATVPHTDQPA